MKTVPLIEQMKNETYKVHPCCKVRNGYPLFPSVPFVSFVDLNRLRGNLAGDAFSALHGISLKEGFASCRMLWISTYSRTQRLMNLTGKCDEGSSPGSHCRAI